MLWKRVGEVAREEENTVLYLFGYDTHTPVFLSVVETLPHEYITFAPNICSMSFPIFLFSE